MDSSYPHYARLRVRKKRRNRDTRVSKYKNKDSTTHTSKPRKSDSPQRQSSYAGVHRRRNTKRDAFPCVTDKRLTLRGTVSSSPHSRGELLFKTRKEQSNHDLKHLLASVKCHKSKKHSGGAPTDSDVHLHRKVITDSSSEPDDPDISDQDDSQSLNSSFGDTLFVDNGFLPVEETQPQVLHSPLPKKTTSRTFQPIRSQPQEHGNSEGLVISAAYDKLAVQNGHLNPQVDEKVMHLPHSNNFSKSCNTRRLVTSELDSPAKAHDDLRVPRNATVAATSRLSFSTYLKITIDIADYCAVEKKRIFPGPSYVSTKLKSLRARARQGCKTNLTPELNENKPIEDQEVKVANGSHSTMSLLQRSEQTEISVNSLSQLENYPESTVSNAGDSAVEEDGEDMKDKTVLNKEHFIKDDVERAKMYGVRKVDAWLSANLSRGVKNKKRTNFGSPEDENEMFSPEIKYKKQYTALTNSSCSPNFIDNLDATQHISSAPLIHSAPFFNSQGDMSQSKTAHVPRSIEFLERTLGRNNSHHNKPSERQEKMKFIFPRSDQDSILNREIEFSPLGERRTSTVKTVNSDTGFFPSRWPIECSLPFFKHLKESSQNMHQRESHDCGGKNASQSTFSFVSQELSSSDEMDAMDMADVKYEDNWRTKQNDAFEERRTVTHDDYVTDTAAKGHPEPENLRFYPLHPRKLF